MKDFLRVVVYLDDILISGKSESEHMATLEAVLQRLAGAGLHLKREKFTFLVLQLLIWDTELILRDCTLFLRKYVPYKMPQSHTISYH